MQSSVLLITVTIPCSCGCLQSQECFLIERYSHDYTCVLHAKLINSECMGGHKDITTILSHALTYIYSVILAVL